jgi:hypothetical protein
MAIVALAKGEPQRVIWPGDSAITGGDVKKYNETLDLSVLQIDDTRKPCWIEVTGLTGYEMARASTARDAADRMYMAVRYGVVSSVVPVDELPIDAVVWLSKIITDKFSKLSKLQGNSYGSQSMATGENSTTASVADVHQA